MNGPQPHDAGAGGQLGTNTDTLRSFGQQITAHGGILRELGIAEAMSGATLPGGDTARALANAADACGTALGRVHADYTFAGDESVTDSARFEEHEQDHEARFRALGDQSRGA